MNPQKGDDASFLNRMVFSLERVPWAEHGYYYTAQDTPGKHPYHEAGVYYIQEPSAMAPAAYLTRQMADGAGERILDLCAAPGGKSTQIAAAMAGRGILISNEIHPARAKILSENIERMGIANAVVTNETPQRLAEHFSEYFTRIMVDAPCSGEGMFRKNEEACEQWSTQNVELCADRQDEILDCAASMLAGGGRLVYSTCTFAPAEDEEVSGDSWRDIRNSTWRRCRLRRECRTDWENFPRRSVCGRISFAGKDIMWRCCARRERLRTADRVC